MKVFILILAVCLAPFGKAAVAADASVALLGGFVAMDANNPPSSEAYVKKLKGEGHVMNFSADRKNDRKAYSFIKEKGPALAGPIGAGTIAIEIEMIKKEMAKGRTGWKGSYAVRDTYPGSLPYDLCEGFEWEAKFEPKLKTRNRKSFVMHGISISCFFLGKTSAWVTNAAVSENYRPELNQKLSPDFRRTATQILSSLKY